jgi:hypothetical protein
MNPSIKDDCSGLVVGTYYCFSTYPDGIPGGQPGWTGPTYEMGYNDINVIWYLNAVALSKRGSSRHAKFYKVAARDTCYDIAQDNDIYLQANVYVCVGFA